MDTVIALIMWVGFFAASVAIYAIPSAVAYSKRNVNLTAIFLLNIFLGWTFLGWVAALVWASMATQQSPVPIGTDSKNETPKNP